MLYSSLGVESSHRRRRAHDEHHKRAIAAIVSTWHVQTRPFRRRGTRGPTRLRSRMDWSIRFNVLTEKDFFQRYRMDKETFNEVVDKIKVDCEPKTDRHGRYKWSLNAGRGALPITTELQLSATIRFLAGGAWQDIVDMHGIAESTLRSIIKKVVPSCMAYSDPPLPSMHP